MESEVYKIKAVKHMNTILVIVNEIEKETTFYHISFHNYLISLGQMAGYYCSYSKKLPAGQYNRTDWDIYQSPLILTELFQHNLINVSYLTACYLYQVMMTLHFLNDVANDAESTQKSKNYVIIASFKSV